MENPQRKGISYFRSPFAAQSALAFDLFRRVVGYSGRNGVQIFGVSPEHVAMYLIAGILLGFPLAIIVSILPIWDYVGDIAPIKVLNAYVAPGLPSLGYEHLGTGGPLVPSKRHLIAMMSVLELIFLSNFFALFSSGVRRHALLVWRFYGRERIFLYLGISGLLFGGLWFVFFTDWRILTIVESMSHRAPYGPRNPYQQLELWSGLAMPISAFMFGHMLAIVGLGVWRDASKRLGHYSEAE